MVVSINEIYKKAVVMPDDTIKARPMCNVNILVDHRFCDGGRSKSLNKLVFIYMINIFILTIWLFFETRFFLRYMK